MTDMQMFVEIYLQVGIRSLRKGKIELIKTNDKILKRQNRTNTPVLIVAIFKTNKDAYAAHEK
jgi:hypothetical protein